MPTRRLYNSEWLEKTSCDKCKLLVLNTASADAEYRISSNKRLFKLLVLDTASADAEYRISSNKCLVSNKCHTIDT